MTREVLLDSVDAAAKEELHAVDTLEFRPAGGADHEAMLPCRVVLLVADRQHDLRRGHHGKR